ncbi:unnamed protein product [Gadus morhua 'NCC']
MKRLSTGFEGWNGTANTMGDPPVARSERLFSLACSLSGLGQDAANGTPSGLHEKDVDDEPPPPESGIELGPGLYFADGRKKVDYVLCYKYKKRRGSKPRLSIVSNGSIAASVSGFRGSEAELGEAGLAAVEGEESKLTEEEKAVMRAEFESGLQEAGLHIERDKQTSLHGVAFIRLHIPWPILSREAELQKIKVAVKKKCEMRERSGIAGIWDSVMTKITQPLQPDVSDVDDQQDSKTRVQLKTLKHPFIREKLQLYDIKSTETLFCNSTRSRIVAEIMSRTTTQSCQTTGITSLLARDVYDSAFPLHDGSFTRRGRKDQRNERQLLHEEWANYGVMHKYQPVDLIRKYFGEQIGLYFAWLGVYTQLLIPPSLLGIVVFVYGILTVDTNVPSQETCDDHLNITMCPLCDGVCDYWRLSSVCSLAKASYLFDNGATVLFAIFMSLWAACFLEHWKRRQMCLKHSWDLTSLEDEEFPLSNPHPPILHPPPMAAGSSAWRQHSGERDQMLSTQLQLFCTFRRSRRGPCSEVTSGEDEFYSCRSRRRVHPRPRLAPAFPGGPYARWGKNAQVACDERELFIRMHVPGSPACLLRVAVLPTSVELIGAAASARAGWSPCTLLACIEEMAHTEGVMHKYQPVDPENGRQLGLETTQTGSGTRCSPPRREPESLDIEDHLSGYLINVSTLLLLIGVTFSAVFGVAVYRICMLTVWSMNPDPEAKASVRMTVTTTGIVLNMLVVLVLEEVYGAFAVWLTELELPKTEAEFEERLIFKSFFLKSMNSFAPIFYVAFFKGRFAGRPGDYVYIFGDYRMEECAPPGCLIELCIQLSMIMLGKQLIQNNVFEVVIPKLKKMYRTMQEEKGKQRAACGAEAQEQGPRRPKQQFDKDFALEPFEGTCPEYMEMIIQYGFVSLFVASFPLAPAFALLNNVIEIRLDAAKFVSEIRRPDAVRCKDIGIWYNILCGISKFSVITNAFVISFTSEFIPRMLYQYMYSANGTMHGYTEHSLAYFNISNFPAGSAPTSTLIRGVSMCRYKDYRDPPWADDAYTFSKQYWSVLAARLAFVIFFQNLAMFLSMLVAWLIPDVPRSLREQLKKENMMLMEFLLNEEAASKPRSSQEVAPASPANIDIVVEAPYEDEEEEEKEEEQEEAEERKEEEEREEGLKEKEEEQEKEEEKEKVKEKEEEKEEEKKKEEEKEKEEDKEKEEEKEKEERRRGGRRRPGTTRERDPELEMATGGEAEERADNGLVDLVLCRKEMEEHLAEKKEEEGEHRPEEKAEETVVVEEARAVGEEVEEAKVVVEEATVVVEEVEEAAVVVEEAMVVMEEAAVVVEEAKGVVEEVEEAMVVMEEAAVVVEDAAVVVEEAKGVVVEAAVVVEDAAVVVEEAKGLVEEGTVVVEDGTVGVEEAKVVEEEEQHFSIDLDLFMDQLGLLDDDDDDGPSSSKGREMELPLSDTRQQPPHLFELPGPPHLAPKQGSSYSLSGATVSTRALESDPGLYSLKGPPPPDARSRGMARCSTLPSRPRGSATSYSLPRPSQSTSLTKLQQMSSNIPLVPLCSGVSLPPADPFSPPRTPRSLTPLQPAHSPPAGPESPRAQLPFELFTLRGPPPQEPRSRAKSRCSTLPARRLGPGAEDRAVKPSQSTGFTQQGERIPPSPSELKGDSLL